MTEDGDGQGPQGKKHRPQHNFSWRDHVAKFTAAEFKKRYRLDFKLHLTVILGSLTHQTTSENADGP